MIRLIVIIKKNRITRLLKKPGNFNFSIKLSFFLLQLFLRIFLSWNSASNSYAQNKDSIDFISILSIIDSEDISANNVKEEKKDSVPEDMLSIIRNVYSQNKGDSFKVKSKEELENETVNILDYLSGVYKSHDFYEDGFWGKPGPNTGKIASYSYPVYKGKVPPSSKRDFYRPVLGTVTSGFGYRPRFNRVHYGVDISLNKGDTVRAALPGIVVFVNYEAKGYGNYIVIAHSDGMETRYGHLSTFLVSPGETVMAGDAIALGGNTGNSTGPHLHFETRYQGVPMDPAYVFDF